MCRLSVAGSVLPFPPKMLVYTSSLHSFKETASGINSCCVNEGAQQSESYMHLSRVTSLLCML